MDIAVFTETFLPNVDGVVVSIRNMNRMLMKRENNVSVFTVGEGPDSVDGYDVFRSRGVSLLSYKNYKMGLPSRRTLETLARKKVDILHSRGPFSMGLAALRASRVMDIPLVGTFDTPVHEYVHYLPVAGSLGMTRDAIAGLAKKYSMMYYNRCDVITAPSETVKAGLYKMGCRGRIDVLSNGVDFNVYSPGNSSDDLKRRFCKNGGPMILHVGRITTEKGIGVLLKAAKELKSSRVGFKLVIVGKGPALEQYKAASESMGLSDCVVFAGFVPDEELPKYYASSDLFITASAVETQGIVILEALASGIPVIGARAGAIPELVKEGRNGMLFSAGDHCALAEKIKEALEGGSLDSPSGIRASVSSHNLERVCDRVENIYNKLIK